MAEIEAVSAQAGLNMMTRLKDQETADPCGAWGSQQAHRHGSEGRYVVYAGCIVPTEKPSMRAKGYNKIPLRSCRPSRRTDACRMPSPASVCTKHSAITKAPLTG